MATTTATSMATRVALHGRTPQPPGPMPFLVGRCRFSRWRPGHRNHGSGHATNQTKPVSLAPMIFNYNNKNIVRFFLFFIFYFLFFIYIFFFNFNDLHSFSKFPVLLFLSFSRFLMGATRLGGGGVVWWYHFLFFFR
jgi:hypothetical protein